MFCFATAAAANSVHFVNPTTTPTSTCGLWFPAYFRCWVPQDNRWTHCVKFRYTMCIGHLKSIWLLPAIFGNFGKYFGEVQIKCLGAACGLWAVQWVTGALHAVPTSFVPNVWQEGGMNSVPALVCLAARHFSLFNQTVRLEWERYSCIFPSPRDALSLSHEKRMLVRPSFPLNSIKPPLYTVTLT